MKAVTVTCVHLFKLQLRYKLRRYLLYASEKRGSGESPFTDVPGNLISFVCISRAAAPFLPATDADLQRFYKEYFVDSDSEDDGILFKRRMFVRGPVHLINLGRDRKSRADEADRTIY